MSQIDLSQGTAPFNTRARSAAVPSPTSSESLAAPGLALPPPVSQGQIMANQLSDALGNAGNFGRELYYVAKEKRYEDRIQTSEQRRLDAQAKEIDRGQAALDASTVVPETRAKILTGELAPAPGETPQEFSLRVAGDQVHPQHSDEYHAAYLERTAGHYAAAAQERLTQLDKRARKENGTITMAQAANSTDPKDFDRAAASLQSINPDLSETESKAHVANYAMDIAARSGNKDAFEAAKGFAPPGTLAAETLIHAKTLDTTLREQQRQVNQDFSEGIDGMLVQRMADRGSISYDEIRRSINQDNGPVDERTLRSSLLKVRAQEHGEVEHVTRAQLQQEHRDAVDEAVHTLAPVLQAGDLTGGAAAIPDEDLTYQRSDGTEAKITRKELDAALLTDAYKPIDAAHPLAVGPDGQVDWNHPSSVANLRDKLDFLGRKNPTLKDPQISAMIDGFASRLTPNMTDQSVPPAALNAYQFFKTASDINPSVVARHADPLSLETLRTVRTVEEDSHGVTPAGAMATVATNLAADPTKPEKIILRGVLPARHEKTITAAVGQAVNAGWADAKVQEIAHVRMLGGSAPKAALDGAVKSFQEDHQLVTGYWVRTVGRAILGSEDLNRAAGAIIQDYRNTNPSLPASSLTLAPVPRTQNWRVMTADGSIPAPGTTEYSDADLLRIRAEWAMHESDAASAKNFIDTLSKQVPGVKGAMDRTPGPDELPRGNTLEASPTVQAIRDGTFTKPPARLAGVLSIIRRGLNKPKPPADTGSLDDNLTDLGPG